MGKIIGIDLGTTNSVVAVMEGTKAKVIANQEGGRTTPSVVAWNDKGETLVGQIALRQAVVNPTRTVFSAKRFIGRKFAEIKNELTHVPYTVKGADNGDAHIEIDGKLLSPPEISAKVLRKLKEAAEAYLGETVTEAVITVPAYFNDSQRNATKDAGRIAGLEVKRIVNEPTAAALAYGLDQKSDETVAVFDLGGGTFDVSILEVSDNVVEVKATNGDTHLGGDDVDNALIHFLVDEFKKDQGIDLANDKMAMQRLKEAAEKAKKELSTMSETEVNLAFITMDATGPKHLQQKISRAKLEQLCDDVFRRLYEPCKKALADAGKKPSDIDEVILVGGSTRIPKVREIVKEIFGKEPNQSVNPDEVVAEGAAVQAGVLSGEVKDMLLLDVTPLTLGVETLGGVMTPMVKRNTTIPHRKTEVFSTADDGQSAVTIKVYQGEREMARDNKLLGQFNLEGIPPAPRGVPQIEVTFDLDANGILHVNAKDKATGKEQRITVQGGSGLSKDEVDNLIKEAEAHADEDKKAREAVDVRNTADGAVYQLEKTLKEHGDKLQGEDRAKLDQALADAKAALEGDDIEKIKSTQETLKNAAFKLSEALYAAQGGAEGQAPDAAQAEAAPAEGKDDDVVDAEFEVN
ncbi:MAG: molecular chaperone DnaK [Deltaproteobacteria bacterium]|nr:molecular chaperone DnaK [Deltaproteobacteria bacterium]